MLGAQLTSCCCNPADTPAGRQTDGPTDRPGSRLGVFIAALPMHPRSKLRGQLRPEGKPIPNMLFITVCGIHKSAFHKYKRWSGSFSAIQHVRHWSCVITSDKSSSLSHLVERCACWNVPLPRLMNTFCYTSANNTVRMCA